MTQRYSSICAAALFAAFSSPEAPFKMPDVPVWRVPAREFPITDYGAVTGDVKNTEAFVKEIVVVNAKNVTMDGKPVPSRPGKAPAW